jgi:hypothetical protein
MASHHAFEALCQSVSKVSPQLHVIWATSWTVICSGTYFSPLLAVALTQVFSETLVLFVALSYVAFRVATCVETLALLVFVGSRAAFRLVRDSKGSFLFLAKVVKFPSWVGRFKLPTVGLAFLFRLFLAGLGLIPPKTGFFTLLNPSD